MKKPQRFIFLILAASLVGGCKVGPNYHRPDIQTPAAYRDSNENPQAQAQAASYADLPWWEVFQDAQLHELIRTALKQNYDLQIATERINAARAQLVVTRSSLFPQVQGNGNFSGGKENNFQTRVQFSDSDWRRGVSVGLVRKVAPRYGGSPGAAPGYGGCATDGYPDAGKRRGQ